VGSGPLERELREWAKRYPGRVAIETAVRHDAVPQWLNAMDVLCAPSRTTAAWREQFGRMLIEAFASGVPVIASASGEIPHVVGEAGILVREGDDAAWAGELGGLLRDPARRAELGAKGRQRALATFDWPVVARQHAAYFERTIEGPRSSREDVA
jgi:glycosyltransferase involved in cell wall biosynthesis